MKCVRCGKTPDQDWAEGHEFWDGEESMVVCRECSTHPYKDVMHKDVVAAKSKGTIRYSRGFPYGAPLVRLYGQTFKAKDYLKGQHFQWNPQYKCWETYLNKDEFAEILRELVRQRFVVKPKDGMNVAYIIDLGLQVTP